MWVPILSVVGPFSSTLFNRLGNCYNKVKHAFGITDAPKLLYSTQTVYFILTSFFIWY